MTVMAKLLRNNVRWAEERVREDAQYFAKLAEQQAPKVLWIGCSDSRVAANVITGTQPGEIFVHRNLANLVIPTDLNLLSVLEYGLRVLKVSEVVVCGHYGCGGVAAALGRRSFGTIDPWLQNLKDVVRMHRAELSGLSSEKLRCNRLVELSVLEQVHRLATTTVIQEIWRVERRPRLHGWVYGLETGRIVPLLKVPARARVDPIYRHAR